MADGRSATGGGPTPPNKSEAKREQIKLGAAYINGIAMGFFLVGGLSIPASILLNASGGGSIAVALLFGAFCLCASPLLHASASKSLEELDK